MDSPNKERAEILRAIRESLPEGLERDTLSAVAHYLDSETKRYEDSCKLQGIGRSCAESIAEMVAALECDYDRLQELRDERSTGEVMDSDDMEELRQLEEAAGDCESREDAERRIQEDPLSIELSGQWSIGEDPTADRAYILLGTGGPAVRIVCEFGHGTEPHRAWIEAQDWFQPWTEYHGDAISSNDLLTYCGCFYFGEG